MHYVYEFLGLMAVFSVLVVSPGADFLLVVRQSLVRVFLSLFTALVSHDTPATVQAVYGLLMAATLILWFVAVSSFFTVASVRARFLAWGRWFNRVTGVIFIGLGIRLATQQAS